MSPLPALIPRTVLFGNPDRASAQLSPDGTRLAFLAPLDGVLNVWVGPADGDDFVPVTADAERGVRFYTWAHDNRHLLYLQDRGGDENWRLYRVRPGESQGEDLTPFDAVQVQLLAHEKERPHEALLAMNRDDARLHDVYHLDLRTGALEQVAKNPGDVTSWVADAGLRVRAALASTPDGGSVLRVRGEHPALDWREVLAWSPEDALGSGPLSFSRDGGRLHLLDSRDANAARLVRLDLTSGDREVLAADDRFDVSDVVFHPDTREVQMVGFTRARHEWTVLDRSVAPDVEAIHRLNPGDFQIADRTHADDVWLVAFTRDTEAVSFWRYDRASRAGRLLFTTRPAPPRYPRTPARARLRRAHSGDSANAPPSNRKRLVSVTRPPRRPRTRYSAPGRSCSPSTAASDWSFAEK